MSGLRTLTASATPHRRLAGLSEGGDRDKHLAAARAAWTSIDRADLVALLE